MGRPASSCGSILSTTMPRPGPASGNNCGMRALMAAAFRCRTAVSFVVCMIFKFIPQSYFDMAARSTRFLRKTRGLRPACFPLPVLLRKAGAAGAVTRGKGFFFIAKKHPVLRFHTPARAAAEQAVYLRLFVPSERDGAFPDERGELFFIQFRMMVHKHTK